MRVATTFVPPDVVDLVCDLRVLESAEILGQRVALEGLLHTVDVVPLQETGLRTVDVTGVETIYSALVWRVLVSEFLINTDEFLQILTLIDVNINEACLELLHLECSYQILKCLRKVELDFVLLKILFEKVLHHLIVLIE